MLPPFSSHLLCILASSRPRRLSLTTPPPPAGGAHLHTVIRFLRSTATLREDAFLEDNPRAMVVWTKLASIQICGYCCRRQLPLTLPGAPTLHRRITAGPSARRGTSTPPRPSSSRYACCPAPWLPPPAAIPKQNKAGEGTLRGAEPGPVTPSPSRPPPQRQVTSKPSSPAPRQPGTNPQRVQDLGGRGEGGGLWERREGPRERQRLEGRKAASGLPFTPRLRAQDPTSRVSASRRLYSLVSAP